MAYAGRPVVRNGALFLLDSADPIQVDSVHWFAWLDEAHHFSYMSTQTSYRMTMRKEKRRHDLYWYAYLKEAGKLHNAYVGRSQTMTAARLEQIIQRLVEKVRPSRSQPGRTLRLASDDPT
jgi:LuxR family transcriptional regulator, maltose regulon positive regulatory protein